MTLSSRPFAIGDVVCVDPSCYTLTGRVNCWKITRVIFYSKRYVMFEMQNLVEDHVLVCRFNHELRHLTDHEQKLVEAGNCVCNG